MESTKRFTAGVITWAWSQIKFQADMRLLLTFIFVWNMLGALVVIPALVALSSRHDGAAATRLTDEQSARRVAA